MSMRKMWTHQGWDEPDIITSYVKQALSYEVPVFVLDAEGAPDFGPGDEVRDKANHIRFVVDGVYVDSEGVWCVAAYDEYGNPNIYYASSLERIPTETTTLLRLTGPEDGVEATVERLEINAEKGVRVEIVEDERCA